MVKVQPRYLRVTEDALIIPRKKAISLPKIIHAMSKERFVEKQKKNGNEIYKMALQQGRKMQQNTERNKTLKTDVDDAPLEEKRAIIKYPKMLSGQRQESCRLFMDDIATTAETTVQSKHLLIKLIGKLKWAGLTVKPEKCRSMVIKKGKLALKPCKFKAAR